MITVTIDGKNQPITYDKLKTVLQLLHNLHLRVNDALIIRDGELLTPDRHLWPGDQITVRMVVSRG
jgi:sulfur carrier protein